MVLDYYQLKEQAFGVTPDSRFLFMSETHKEALASLLYGIESGCGFVALIAPPGLGKTTLLYHTLNFLRDRVTTVFLFQTVRTPNELLRAILAELGMSDTGEELGEMQAKLKGLLKDQLANGRRVVVVIDEAQNLDESVLELVRMLSNFETPREKLIQIILAGQPQLAEKMALPELVQLRQRVSIIAHLEPFSVADTALYIDHRLRTAGYQGVTGLFQKDAVELIAEHSQGIPRNINNLCFNALSIGCALKRPKISGEIIREVVSDLDLSRWQKKKTLEAQPVPLTLPEPTSAERPMFSFVEKDTPANHLTRQVAVGVAAMLAVGIVLIGGHRWIAPRSASAISFVEAAVKKSFHSEPRKVVPVTQHKDEPVVPAPSTPAAASTQPAISHAAVEAPAPPQQVVTNTIEVKPGRTLLGLCDEKYGSCNPKLLEEIHRLNPQLTNPDHIEPGQTIRMPVLEAMRGTASVPGNAPLGEDTSQ